MRVHRCRFARWQPAAVTCLRTSALSGRLAVGRADGEIEVREPRAGDSSSSPQAQLPVEISVAGRAAGRGMRSVEWAQPLQQLQQQEGRGIQEKKDRLFVGGDAGMLVEIAVGGSETGVGVRRCCDSFGGAIADLAACPRPRSDAERLLAVACEDGVVRIFSYADDDLVYDFSFPFCECRFLSLAWHDDDGASAARDAAARQRSTGVGAAAVAAADTAGGAADASSAPSAPVDASARTVARRLVAGADDGNIRILDVASRTILGVLRGDVMRGKQTSIRAVSVLRDFTIVSGDSNGSVQFWDGRTRSLVQTVKQTAHDIRALAVSHNEQHVFASGNDPKVVLISLVPQSYRAPDGHTHTVPSWVYVGAQRPHSHEVYALATVRDAAGSERLVSAGIDTKLCLYSVSRFLHSRGKNVLSLPPRPVVAYSPTTRCALVTHTDRLDLWQLSAPQRTDDLREEQEEEEEEEEQEQGEGGKVQTTGDGKLHYGSKGKRKVTGRRKRSAAAIAAAQEAPAVPPTEPGAHQLLAQFSTGGSAASPKQRSRSRVKHGMAAVVLDSQNAFSESARAGPGNIVCASLSPSGRYVVYSDGLTTQLFAICHNPDGDGGNGSSNSSRSSKSGATRARVVAVRLPQQATGPSYCATFADDPTQDLLVLVSQRGRVQVVRVDATSPTRSQARLLAVFDGRTRGRRAEETEAEEGGETERKTANTTDTTATATSPAASGAAALKAPPRPRQLAPRARSVDVAPSLVACSADGQWVAAGDRDGNVIVFNLDTSRRHWALNVFGAEFVVGKGAAPARRIGKGPVVRLCALSFLGGAAPVLLACGTDNRLMAFDMEAMRQAGWSVALNRSGMVRRLSRMDAPMLKCATNPEQLTQFVLQGSQSLCFVDTTLPLPTQGYAGAEKRRRVQLEESGEDASSADDEYTSPAAALVAATLAGGAGKKGVQAMNGGARKSRRTRASTRLANGDAEEDHFNSSSNGSDDNGHSSKTEVGSNGEQAGATAVTESGQQSTKAGARNAKTWNFSVQGDYQSLVHAQFVGQNDLLVVENPWINVLAALPDPVVVRSLYGT